jgi:hypothetical protein
MGTEREKVATFVFSLELKTGKISCSAGTCLVSLKELSHEMDLAFDDM